MEVMRLLVRRYITAEQKKSEQSEVTEDDFNEIKQDISSFRFELIDILKDNGMKTSSVAIKQEDRQRKLFISIKVIRELVIDYYVHYFAALN